MAILVVPTDDFVKELKRIAKKQKSVLPFKREYDGQRPKEYLVLR